MNSAARSISVSTASGPRWAVRARIGAAASTLDLQLITNREDFDALEEIERLENVRRATGRA
jgi:hypothetical protein